MDDIGQEYILKEVPLEESDRKSVNENERKVPK